MLSFRVVIGAFLAVGASLELAPLCFAQVGGPVTGYLFDPTVTALRPIQGIVGAATLGQPVGEAGIRNAVSAPSRNFSLLVREESETPLVLFRGMGTDAPEILPLAEISSRPDLLVISRDGAVAVAYHDATKTVRIVRGLPDVPQISKPADVTSLGTLESAAVDGEGRVLLAVEQNNVRSLYHGSISAEGYLAPRLLGTYAGKLAVAVNADGSRGAVADSAGNQFLLIDDLSGSAAVRVVARSEDGIDRPVAVGLTEDAAVVASEAATALTFRLGSGQLEKSALPVSPSRLEPVGSSIFVLNSPGKGPVYLFDTKSSAVFFLPASQARRRGAAQ